MITYKKLFHMLIDKDIKKGELAAKASLPPNTMQRLAKNKTINTETINKICQALDCQPGDIMEFVPDDSDMNIFERNKQMQKEIKEAETNKEAIERIKYHFEKNVEHYKR